MDPYGNIPGHLGIKLHKIYDVPGEVSPETSTSMPDQWLLWITETSGIILKLSLTSPQHKQQFGRVAYFSSNLSSELDAFWSGVRAAVPSVVSPRYAYLSCLTLVWKKHPKIGESTFRTPQNNTRSDQPIMTLEPRLQAPFSTSSRTYSFRPYRGANCSAVHSPLSLASMLAPFSTSNLTLVSWPIAAADRSIVLLYSILG